MVTGLDWTGLVERAVLCTYVIARHGNTWFLFVSSSTLSMSHLGRCARSPVEDTLAAALDHPAATSVQWRRCKLYFQWSPQEAVQKQGMACHGLPCLATSVRPISNYREGGEAAASTYFANKQSSTMLPSFDEARLSDAM